MARRMTEDQLLSQLQRYEEESSEYTFGALRSARERAYSDYFQQPYGNEEPGWSQIVTSDVQDTVEWALPYILDKFTSTENAVEFEPTQAADVKGAEQATDACNYVFHKQNNGFLNMYTMFKDALLVKNSAVHWYKETKQVVEKLPLRNVPMEAVKLAEKEGWEAPDEIEELDPQPMMGPQGPMLDASGKPIMVKLYNALMCKKAEKKTVKIDVFEPEHLRIARDWTSPLLEDCPYVARDISVTLSDLKEMGFKNVDPEDLAASSRPNSDSESIVRRVRRDNEGEYLDDDQELDTEDESQTKGWLRIEWVLADRDGDGIAERLEVYRLADKILSEEECSHVPIATGSPILVSHQWDGMSLAETVADLQRIRSDMFRTLMNNAHEASDPKKTVLTDIHGAPQAVIDDILDGRPGGMIRIFRPDAVNFSQTPFVGNQIMGMMEYLDQMREQRTGITKQQQGVDPNALRPDRTATEVQVTANAMQQRVNLIARVLAETLMKPIFRGILRLLTEGDMEAISFRLRGDFVQMDPNEWRDNYDMTIRVGLGTGDRDRQLMVLNNTFQTQMAMAQTPLAPMLLKPKHFYNTQAKMLELNGFKQTGEFFADPGPNPFPPPPQSGPPPQVMIEQMKQQADAQKFQAQAAQDQQKFQAEAALKQQELQMQYQKEAENDARDFEKWKWEAQSKERIELAKIEAERLNNLERNRTSIITARIAHPETQLTDLDIDPETGEVYQKPDPLEPLLSAVGQIAAQQTAPKLVIRDPMTNKVVGVQQGDVVQQVVRDASGQVVGIQ